MDLSPVAPDLEVVEEHSGPRPAEAVAQGRTIPQLFFTVARERGSDVAVRCKVRGLWTEVTWQTYANRVRNLAMGLRELGVERGDRVAILGDPCLEWLVAELAVQSLGAISFGIYPTSPTPEVQHVLADSGAVVAIAEDQEDVDKILEASSGLPQLRATILIDTTGVFDVDAGFVRSFESVERSGEVAAVAQPDLIEHVVAGAAEDDVALLIYTSGTTALPKGAMVTHRAVVKSWPNVVGVLPALSKRDRIVSYLPLAHIGERTFSLFLPLLTGAVVHFGESPDAVNESLVEVRPTIYSGPPRMWEKMAARILVDVDTASWLKRSSFRLAMATGRKYQEAAWQGGSSRPSRALAMAYAIARFVVFRPMLDKLGFDRISLAITGTAPVPPEIVRTWQIWGVQVRESYGQTETQMATLQYDNPPVPGNAGLPLPGVSLATAADGEILIDSPGNFAGYWGMPEVTAETINGRWVRTGDLGEWLPSGHLRIVGRKKDIIITSGGKNISPAAVENALKTSPFISEVVAIGDGRRYLTALIEIDEDTTAEWARRNDVTYTSFRSLVEHHDVIKLIGEEIDRANLLLARVEQVKKFRLLPKELDVDDGETTATRKVKRQSVIEMFGDLVEAMYGDDREPAAAT